MLVFSSFLVPLFFLLHLIPSAPPNVDVGFSSVFGATFHSLGLSAVAESLGLGEGAVGSQQVGLIYLLMAFVGFFAFGPHMLIGLTAREVAPAGVGATANGFAKMIGQVGGMIAGYPLSLLMKSYGWEAIVVCWAFSGIGACLCFFLLRKV